MNVFHVIISYYILFLALVYLVGCKSIGNFGELDEFASAISDNGKIVVYASVFLLRVTKIAVTLCTSFFVTGKV